MSKVKTLANREAHKIFNFGNVQKILKRKIFKIKLLNVENLRFKNN